MQVSPVSAAAAPRFGSIRQIQMRYFNANTMDRQDAIKAYGYPADWVKRSAIEKIKSQLNAKDAIEVKHRNVSYLFIDDGEGQSEEAKNAATFIRSLMSKHQVLEKYQWLNISAKTHKNIKNEVEPVLSKEVDLTLEPRDLKNAALTVYFQCSSDKIHWFVPELLEYNEPENNPWVRQNPELLKLNDTHTLEDNNVLYCPQSKAPSV